MTHSSNLERYSAHLNPFTANFCDIAQHIDYLYSNVLDMMILYFCYNLSYICY